MDQTKGRRSLLLIKSIEYTIILLSIVIIVYGSIATPKNVTSDTMSPEIEISDTVLINRLPSIFSGSDIKYILDQRYQRGDIVNLQVNEEEILLRVIGMPGEYVSIKEGFVYINDRKLEENYLPISTFTGGGDLIFDDGNKFLVPEDSFFLLADKRSKLYDSRSKDLGFAKQSEIKGKVFFRINPLRNFGAIYSVVYD